MPSRHESRILAVQALYAWEANRTNRESALAMAWYEGKESPDYARLLVAGTMEQIEEIDAQIARHLKGWDISRISRVDLAILRLGAWSLRFQPDTDVKVVLDESLMLAHEMSGPSSHRFVNGILDAILRENRGAAATEPASGTQPGEPDEDGDS